VGGLGAAEECQSRCVSGKVAGMLGGWTIQLRTRRIS
jgi:hypothetical protein